MYVPKQQYVDVANEKYHIQHFENKFLRIYFAQIPPLKWTEYHRHSEDTIYIVPIDSRVKNQVLNEDTISLEHFVDQTFFRTGELIHRVWNDNADNFSNFVGIECKKFCEIIETKFEFPEEYQEQIKLLEDNVRGKIYVVNMKGKQTFENLNINITGVMIFPYGKGDFSLTLQNSVKNYKITPNIILKLDQNIKAMSNISDQDLKFYILSLKTHKTDKKTVKVRNGNLGNQIPKIRKSLNDFDQIEITADNKAAPNLCQIYNTLTSEGVHIIKLQQTKKGLLAILDRKGIVLQVENIEDEVYQSNIEQ